MSYNNLNIYLKKRFGEKVYKVTLEMDVTCPNRDGTKGTGGCIYCNPDSNNPFSSYISDDEQGLERTRTRKNERTKIKDQLMDGILYVRKRHGANKFISYFQRHTNTYAPIQILEQNFYEAIDHPDVIGLAVSTRPDCIPNNVLDLLSRLNKTTFIWIELGLQSANEQTLALLNRGHSLNEFIDTVERLHERQIEVCAHIILGLPGETNDDLIKTAKLIDKLGIEGVKIHNLHVLKNTALEKLYNEGEINLPTLSDYAKKVVFLLERLRPEILIHRLNSHAPRDMTVAPKWSVNKLATFNEVEKELELQNTWQGRCLDEI